MSSTSLHTIQSNRWDCSVIIHFRIPGHSRYWLVIYLYFSIVVNGWIFTKKTLSTVLHEQHMYTYASMVHIDMRPELQTYHNTQQHCCVNKSSPAEHACLHIKISRNTTQLTHDSFVARWYCSQNQPPHVNPYRVLKIMENIHITTGGEHGIVGAATRAPLAVYTQTF